MERDRSSSPIAEARYKAVVEYDGANFFGFQRQKDSQVTIQGEIERAIAKIAQRPITISGAGRTDTGVHASGQVISFELNWRHGSDALQNAINAKLRPEIAILEIEEVPFDFHPRFSARRRFYEYTIYNSQIRSPLNRMQCWQVYKPLNVEKMNQAAAVLVGEHDFATFGQPPDGTNTVREVFDAKWHRNGQYLIFNVEATAYLRRMVRSLVGTLKQVGDGSWSAEMFEEAFKAAKRDRAGVTAPPQGLVFKKVLYD